jgi:hypothetical protein
MNTNRYAVFVKQYGWPPFPGTWWQRNYWEHIVRNESEWNPILMEALNLSHRPTFRNNYINPALENEWIERTQPDTPRSPTQRYRLTGKGHLWLQHHADLKRLANFTHLGIKVIRALKTVAITLSTGTMTKTAVESASTMVLRT